MNAIQFQHGLSLPQFQALYSTEQQCERALVAAMLPRLLRALATTSPLPLKVLHLYEVTG